MAAIDEEILKTLKTIVGRLGETQKLIVNGLAGVSATLGELVKLEKLKTPEGKVENFSETITDTIWEIRPVKPYFSFSIINDDETNSVYCSINDSRNHEVKASGSYDVDFRAARIESIDLECDAGKTADVRISTFR